ncbi:MAG TPA: carbon-nitrogen hydrolase family protein [Solirubrobacteraceae bacterium]|jgi:predicted amidohydrolase|nr:carbon-nitrogen hydrolase family protein [Solirubrobacteraceae bacterium]
MTRLPAAIAAVALPSERDLDLVFAAVDWALEEARARGAELVVFPECALGGYLREPDADEPAGPVLPPALEPDGPEIRRLIEAAGDTVVCMGYTEAGPNGPYTSAVCVSGDGIHGHHRKVHLPPAERFAYSPGDGFAAFDTPVGRLGMLLCYDKLFPEAARALALDGAGTIACLSAWPMDRHHPARTPALDKQARHFDALDVARAVENQVVWVSTNQTGRLGPLRFFGHAKVVDPDGAVRAHTGTDAGVAVARIDPDAVEVSRAFIDHLGDRRPASYGPPAAESVRQQRYSG